MKKRIIALVTVLCIVCLSVMLVACDGAGEDNQPSGSISDGQPSGETTSGEMGSGQVGSGEVGSGDEEEIDYSLAFLTENDTLIGVTKYGRNLSTLIIPDGITHIGDEAFKNCSNLTSVELPNSLKSIGNSAFENCVNLKDIEIPSGVESIANRVFANCTHLTKVDMSDQLTSIGDRTFQECFSLTSIEIPISVTLVGEATFHNSYCLTIYCESTEKPSGWEDNWNDNNFPVVWNSAHNDSTKDGIIYYVAENGVRYSLYGVATVARQAVALSGAIVIPSNLEYKGTTYKVTSIGNSAFSDCEELVSVEIPDTVTAIRERAFYRCINLENLKIPNGITKIEENVFSNCKSLAKINIPQNITKIASDAFSNCSGIESINVDNGNLVYKSQNNCIIEKETNTLILGCKNSVIPNYIRAIGSCAFFGCSDLTSVDLPDTVTSIDSSAFVDCKRLNSIKLPENLKSIGNNVFANTGLRSLIIPIGVSTVGRNLLDYCFSVKIYCEASCQPSGWNSSWNNNFDVEWGYGNITTNEDYDYVLHNDKVFLTKYKDNATDVVVPETIDGKEVVSLGFIFTQNQSLTSIVIPTGVTIIDYEAFSGCSSLKSIVIPSGVTRIDDYAFNKCSSLTIYCEADSQPEGWSENWNYSNRRVEWGYRSN